MLNLFLMIIFVILAICAFLFFIGMLVVFVIYATMIVSFCINVYTSATGR